MLERTMGTYRQSWTFVYYFILFYFFYVFSFLLFVLIGQFSFLSSPFWGRDVT